MMHDTVLIFGTGKILEKQKDHIDFEKVLCLVDNDEKKWNQKLYNKEVINPNTIRNYQFDYIVVFSTKYYFNIYSQLVKQLQIPEEKIVSWYYYCDMMNIVAEHRQKISSWDVMTEIFLYVDQKKLYSILDFGQGCSRYGALSKQDVRIPPHAQDMLALDSYNLWELPVFACYDNLYSSIYTKLIDIGSGYYDVIMFIDPFLHMNIEQCKAYIRKTYNLSQYVILNIPCNIVPVYAEWIEKKFQEFGRIEKIGPSYSNYILVIEKERVFSCNIYVVTHKEFTCPSINGYMPIFAGAHKSGETYGYIRDDTNDNISGLNPWINECTALYWMWKHASSEYIGLNHYRRYFLKNDIDRRLSNIVQQDDIENWLKKYDIILPIEGHYYVYAGVKLEIKKSININAYNKGMEIIKKLLQERQPEYLDAFEFVMNGVVFYPYNMFIMKKSIMQQYCEWLFSFIIDAAKSLDVSSYDEYSKRVIGFIAERMLTVWLMHQHYKIKELPILLIE